MAKAPKRKMTVATTFRGRFSWPKLNEPDYGSKDYPKPNGEYGLRLIGDKTDAAVVKFRTKMEAVLAAVKAKAEAEFAELPIKARKQLEAANGPTGLKANPLYSVIYDEETEEETDEIEFKFSMPAKVEIKKGPKAGKVLTFKPIIADARGLPIPSEKLPAIWGGTIGIVSFEFDPEGYFIPGSGLYGVKMRLLGVQIIELKSGGGRNAASLGFTQQEGFSSDDLAENEDEDTEKGDDAVSPSDTADQDF